MVAPGLVDLHAHLRQPGREEAETVETGSRAAALGGYTCVVAMPNTEPAIDCASVVKDVLLLGRDSLCDVRSSAAITVGRAGTQLTEMAELAASRRAPLHRRRQRRAGRPPHAPGHGVRQRPVVEGRGVVLAQHCENEALSAGGHMHEGEWSSRLGIPGQPAESEELMVMRDIALARLTGATIHFQHLSTAGSIAMVRAAKAGGLPVSAEATPHHFTLTDAECAVLRPGVQGQPAAAHRRRRRRGQGRPRRRLHRRHRHRPRPARARAQGAPVRRGAARDARAWRRRWRWPSPSSSSRSPRSSPCSRGARQRSPASTTSTAARSRRDAWPTSA